MATYDELLCDWKNIFKEEPAIMTDFSSYESFQTFVQRVYKDHGGSRTSERYFRLFIWEITRNLDEVEVEKKHKSLKFRLSDSVVIRKIFDIEVKIKEVTFLTELKKNIDLIEKDLFKWFLLSESEAAKEFRKIQLVWEDRDKSKGQYKQLLDYAVKKKWIDAYFYFYLEESSFEEQKRNLLNLLRDTFHA